MVATPWTPLSAPVTPYFEGFISTDVFTGFAIFGLVIPVTSGSIVVDPAVAWTELTVAATAHTELTAPSTSWQELTG